MTIKLDKNQMKDLKNQIKTEPTQKQNKIVYTNPDVSSRDAPKKVKIAKWNLRQGQLVKVRDISGDSMYKYYNYTNIDNPVDRSIEIKADDIMLVLAANFFDSDESKLFVKLGSIDLIRQYSGNQMNNITLCYFQGARLLVCTDLLLSI
jgi:hypothetical protein